MRKNLLCRAAGICATVVAAATFMSMSAAAQDFNRIPSRWKWLDNSNAAFSYDGSFTDEGAFSVNVANYRKKDGLHAPYKYTDYPVKPEGAVNLTYSPDSTMLAFTRDNDLYVVDIKTNKETRLTDDGSELILNGFASWVYYEEIFGRPSRYRAFWWSPDSRKIGFYRFDNTAVPMFPIYSPFGQDGTLHQTRYPKAGENNPEVRIGIIDLDRNAADSSAEIVWADFNPKEDQYFGTPFWGADSKEFFIAREPRIQNTLDLYSVSVADGSKKHIYHEEYKTWLDWINGMLFTDKGLYMVRSFETGWQQIYFLSYDGKTLKRLTDGPNWRVELLRTDKDGSVYYTACRDASVRQCLYKVNAAGEIKALTDTSLNVNSVSFAPDGKHFIAALSNFTTPVQLWMYETSSAAEAWKARRMLASSDKKAKRYNARPANTAYLVADMKGNDYNAANYALPQLIYIENDGLRLPAYIVYPENFDPTKKYPVHVDIYGGPDSPQVRDRWIHPYSSNQWWAKNGIIEVTADCRAAGHNGREGLDQIYKHLNTKEVGDFVAWAKYLQSLPYVQADKIGVEGFSFGGTMTAMLLFTASDYYHYGIAGGGVYDWILYDSHYTERFMETPQTNPEGYRDSRVISYASQYKPTFDGDESVMLKLTHGTGDDNVHFQSTMQLINELQKHGKKFEFMIYPDGMHGYRGYQGNHFLEANHDFWLHYLCGK